MLKEKEEELTKVMKEKKLEILSLCETRTKEKVEKLIHENFKLMCSGKETGSSGVGIMLTLELADRVEKIVC